MHAIMSVILAIVLSVASATAGIPHYCDYLGSTRAVVDTAGMLLQTMNYYPSGVPFSRMEQEAITDRLHTGKPFLDMNGLGYYDNNARFLDILTGGFISRDALAGSYPHLSPYANCANNPLIYIDPDGRVLRDKNGKIIYNLSEKNQKYRFFYYAKPSDTEASYVERNVDVGYIYADDGSKIEVLKNISGDARWDTNCHGTTFADGEYWLDPKNLPALLKGDNYTEIPKEEASKDDIIVAEDNSHSMTITKVDEPFNQSLVYGQDGPDINNSTKSIINDFQQMPYKVYHKNKQEEVIRMENEQKTHR